MFWLSRISEHSSYAGGLLGPMLVIATGLGLLFVPMTLVALTKVRNEDTGVAWKFSVRDLTALLRRTSQRELGPASQQANSPGPPDTPNELTGPPTGPESSP
jgi:hypothetical protein